MINIIVSVSKNNVIGRKGELPWELPADLSYFLKKTAGHYLIMGEATYFSIKSRFEDKFPRENRFFGKGRKSIVLSHKQLEDLPKNVLIAHSIDQALDIVGEDDCYVIGGGSVYAQFMSLADRLYVTEVDTIIENGDTFLPKINADNWKLVANEQFASDERNEYNYSFNVYDKI